MNTTIIFDKEPSLDHYGTIIFHQETTQPAHPSANHQATINHQLTGLSASLSIVSNQPSSTILVINHYCSSTTIIHHLAGR